MNGYYSIPDTDFKCDWDDYRQQYGLEKTLNSFDENLVKLSIENLIKPETCQNMTFKKIYHV